MATKSWLLPWFWHTVDSTSESLTASAVCKCLGRRWVWLYFIIVNLGVNHNPKQKRTLTSQHCFLVNENLYNMAQLATPIFKRGEIRSVLFQKRRRTKSLMFFLWTLFFCFSPLVWERLLRHNMWSGQTNRRTRYFKQCTTMRASCYPLHNGGHMGTCKQKWQNADLLTSSVWTHVTWTF